MFVAFSSIFLTATPQKLMKISKPVGRFLDPADNF